MFSKTRIGRRSKANVRSRYRLTVERLESRALFAGLINIDMPIAPAPPQAPNAIVSAVDTTMGGGSNTAASDEVPFYLDEHSGSEGEKQGQNDSGAVNGQTDDDRSDTDETDTDGSTVVSPGKDLGANETGNGDPGDELFSGSTGTASPPVTSPSPPSLPVYSTPPLLSRADSPAPSVSPIVSPNPESHFHYFQSVADQPNHTESAIGDDKLARSMVRDSFVATMSLNQMGDEDHMSKARSTTVLTAHSESANTKSFQSDALGQGVAETERQVLIDRAMSSMEFATDIVQNANLACAASVDANKSRAVTEDIANVESPDIVALTASRSEPKLRLRTSRFELLGLVSMLLPISTAIKKRRQVDRTPAMTVRPQSQPDVRTACKASNDTLPRTSEPPVECRDAWLEAGLTEVSLSDRCNYIEK